MKLRCPRVTQEQWGGGLKTVEGCVTTQKRFMIRTSITKNISTIGDGGNSTSTPRTTHSSPRTYNSNRTSSANIILDPPSERESVGRRHTNTNTIQAIGSANDRKHGKRSYTPDVLPTHKDPHPEGKQMVRRAPSPSPATVPQATPSIPTPQEVPQPTAEPQNTTTAPAPPPPPPPPPVVVSVLNPMSDPPVHLSHRKHVASPRSSGDNNINPKGVMTENVAHSKSINNNAPVGRAATPTGRKRFTPSAPTNVIVPPPTIKGNTNYSVKAPWHTE
eukprot:PhF_6_TR11708/c0_g1_i3/m.19045